MRYSAKANCTETKVILHGRLATMKGSCYIDKKRHAIIWQGSSRYHIPMGEVKYAQHINYPQNPKGLLMKKRKKSNETPQMREERLQFTKCMQTKTIKNKKKYDRKREKQKLLPSFCLFRYISNVTNNGDYYD